MGTDPGKIWMPFCNRFCPAATSGKVVQRAGVSVGLAPEMLPVIVTANDYLNQVSNGDVGVTVVHERPQVAFPSGDGVRLLDPSRLDRIETWWAMTIHKSQGSEFGHVVVVLPPPPSSAPSQARASPSARAGTWCTR